MIGYFASVCFALFALFACGLAIAVCLRCVSKMSGRPFLAVEILCWSFLLAPIAISYVLWIGMLLFPGQIPSWGYLWGIPTLMLVIIVLGRGYVRLLYTGFAREVRLFFARNDVWPLDKKRALFFLAVVVVGILVWANYIGTYKLDISDYLLGGDYFAWSRDVTYHGKVVDSRNGFWYHAYHSYCLPLFATWGCFIRDAFGGRIDWYYRFVILYYWLGLNFVALTYFCRMRLCRTRWMIVACSFVVLNGMPFVWCEVPLEFECDFIRCALITSIALLLWRHLECPQWSSCLVLGILGAAAVAAHGTSFVFVGLLFSTLFFAKTEWRIRLAQMAVIIALIFMTWGLHYVLQTCWGDGWLFPVAKEELASKPSDPWIATRFGGIWSLVFFGYLGQVCNIPHFSMYVVFAMGGVILWLRRPERLPICHVAMLVAVCTAMVIIGKVFYYNFRYQYTFVPLIVLASFWIYVKKASRGCVIGGPAFWAVLMILHCVVGVGSLLHLAMARKAEVGLTRQDLDVKSEKGLAVKVEEEVLSLENGLWPLERNDGYPRVCFHARNKMPYRAAPYPVWYLHKDQTLIGWESTCHCSDQRHLGNVFDYMLCEDRPSTCSLLEVVDETIWRKVACLSGWVLYRSKIAQKNATLGGSNAEQ